MFIYIFFQLFPLFCFVSSFLFFSCDSKFMYYFCLTLIAFSNKYLPMIFCSPPWFFSSWNLTHLSSSNFNLCISKASLPFLRALFHLLGPLYPVQVVFQSLFQSIFQSVLQSSFQSLFPSLYQSMFQLTFQIFFQSVFRSVTLPVTSSPYFSQPSTQSLF